MHGLIAFEQFLFKFTLNQVDVSVKLIPIINLFDLLLQGFDLFLVIQLMGFLEKLGQRFASFLRRDSALDLLVTFHILQVLQQLVYLWEQLDQLSAA
jgi:hypothetical protein